MNKQEKLLYHQIHPVKLFTDSSAGVVALYLTWQHDIISALIVAFVPSVVVSYAIMRFVNLEKYEQSSFGKYVNNHMTRTMMVIRLAGFLVMVIGAWFHLLYLIPVGMFIVILGWSRGLIFRRSQSARSK